jgi:hypothetical protein
MEPPREEEKRYHRERRGARENAEKRARFIVPFTGHRSLATGR